MPKKILRGVTGEEAIQENKDFSIKLCLERVSATEDYCKSMRKWLSSPGDMDPEEIESLRESTKESERYCDSMRQCLKPNASIDRKDKFGVTALTRAIIVNDLGSIRLLLNCKADSNLGNEDGTTPLIQAARMDCSLEIMKVLLKKKADVNAHDYDNGHTPLMFLSMHASVPTVKLLLEEKCIEVDKKDFYGNTALMHAVEQCFENEGKLPLNIIRTLRDCHANLHVKNMEGKNVFDLIEEVKGPYFKRVREALGLLPKKK